MPTRAGWACAVGAVAAYAVGRAFGIGELFVLAAVLLAVVLGATGYTWATTPRLDALRAIVPAQPVAGTAATVDLALRNLSPRSTGTVSVVDAVSGTAGAALTAPAMPPGTVAHLSYRLPTQRRGRVEVGPLVLEHGDPFGAARRRLPLAPAIAITVLPPIEPLTHLRGGVGIDDVAEEGHRPTVAAAATDDLARLRPYVVGDDLRRVHWRTTARTGDLIVRQDEGHHQGHVTIWLDARRTAMAPDDFERAVSAAASLVHAAATEGDRVRLLDSSGTDSAAVDARSARPTLLEHLATVEQHDEPWEPPPAVTATGHLVVLGAGVADGASGVVDALGGARWVRLVDFAPGATRRALPPGWLLVVVPARQPFAPAWEQLAPGRRR